MILERPTFPPREESNIIDLSAARNAATAAVLAEMIPAAPTSHLKSQEELDKQSQILRDAVTYTALNGRWNGAWIAEHTGNSTVVGIVNDGVWERRDATLRKLTRKLQKAKKIRTVELWSLASTAKVVMNQNGDEESGRNLEDFEVLFLRSLFDLIERDCYDRELQDRRE